MRLFPKCFRKFALWMLVVCLGGAFSPTAAANLDWGTRVVTAYPCYRSALEVYALGEQLEAAYPGLARWVDYGDSWKKSESSGSQGYDLRVLELTNQALSGPKPSLVLVSGLSANELPSVEVNIRLGEHLLAQYGNDPDITWMLDKLVIRLVWVANPDGRAKAEEQALAGAPITWNKNIDTAGCADPSLVGVSLNRNFSYAWANSPADGCNPDFPGQAAQSEPETQALQSYLDQVYGQPGSMGGMLINLRTRGNYLVLPWRHTPLLTEDHDWLDILAKKLSADTPFVPNHSSYTTTPPAGTASGTLIDYAYSQFAIPAYELWLGSAQPVGYEMACGTFDLNYLQPSLRLLEKAAWLSLAPEDLTMGPEITSLVVTRLDEDGQLWRVQGEISTTNYKDYITRGKPNRIYFSMDVLPWLEDSDPTPVTVIPDAFLPNSLASFSFTLQTSGLTPRQHMLYLSPEAVFPDNSTAQGIPRSAFIQVKGLTFMPLISR